MPDLNEFLNNPESMTPASTDINDGVMYEEWLYLSPDYLGHPQNHREVLCRIADAVETLCKNSESPVWEADYCSCLIPNMLRYLAGVPYDHESSSHMPWCSCDSNNKKESDDRT